ncbi:MAG: hypothetical protein ACYS0D_03200 [Planctomycetota bacterium]
MLVIGLAGGALQFGAAFHSHPAGALAQRTDQPSGSTAALAGVERGSADLLRCPVCLIAQQSKVGLNNAPRLLSEPAVDPIRLAESQTCAPVLHSPVPTSRAPPLT